MICDTVWGHKHGCDRNASCHLDGHELNDTSKFTLTCHCDPGFKGNGSHCEPICSGGCGWGKCASPEHCECDRGAAGPLCSLCDDQTSTCHSNASCGKTLEAAIAGAFPNASHQPSNTSTAFVADGSYHCACNDGFVGDGLQCQPFCSQGCEHGDCRFQLGETRGECACHKGWQGTDCSECTPGQHSCGAFARCVEENDSNACECLPGYGDVPPCAPVCEQGCDNGHCVGPNECRCSAGFGGQSCSECSSDNNPW